jgi:hypothetical protein
MHVWIYEIIAFRKMSLKPGSQTPMWLSLSASLCVHLYLSVCVLSP